MSTATKNIRIEIHTRRVREAFKSWEARDGSPDHAFSCNLVARIRTSAYDDNYRALVKEMPTAHWIADKRCWELFTEEHVATLLGRLVEAGYRDIHVFGDWLREEYTDTEVPRYYRHPSGEWVAYSAAPSDTSSTYMVSEASRGLDGRPLWSAAEMHSVAPQPGQQSHTRGADDTESSADLDDLLEAAYTRKPKLHHPALDVVVGTDGMTLQQCLGLYTTITYEAGCVTSRRRAGRMSTASAENELQRLRWRMGELLGSVAQAELLGMLYTHPNYRALYMASGMPI